MEAQRTHQGDGMISFDWKATDDGGNELECRVCGLNPAEQGEESNLVVAVLWVYKV